MTNPEFIYLSARLWMDTYGNTYHTVRVTCYGEGEVEHFQTEEPHYGSEAMCDITAVRMLQEAGVFAEGQSKSLYSRCRDQGIRIAEEYIRVQRKKDLHD